MIKENIFENITDALDEEVIELIHESDNVRIERIFSLGNVESHQTWFDQETDEWVILLSGEAQVEFEGEEIITLIKGDYIFIPAHKKHRIIESSKVEQNLWLAIHIANEE